MVSWDVQISGGTQQIPFSCISILYLLGAVFLTYRWAWRVFSQKSSPWKSNIVLLMGIGVYLWLRGAFLCVVAIDKSCKLAYLQIPFVLYIVNKAVLIRLWSSFLRAVSGKRHIELDATLLTLVISSLLLLALTIAAFFDGEMLAVSEYVNLFSCAITGFVLLRLSWLLHNQYSGTGVSMCSLDMVESRAVFATSVFGFYTIGRSLLIVLILLGKEGHIPSLSSATVNDSQWWWTPLFYLFELCTVALCVAMLLETPEDTTKAAEHQYESGGRLLSPRNKGYRGINSNTAMI
jgi:hypothetical protein